MANNEQFNDWVVRYEHLFKLRYTKKQKKNFLQSFLTDLTAIRDDVEVRGDKNDSDSYHVVVGNLETAHYVLATYYDTPAIYFGDYNFFDSKGQQKKTLHLIIFLAVLMLILGIILTYYVSIPILNNQGISIVSVILILLYFIYFWLFGKITRGWPERNNTIRNNSSILYLLQYIAKNNKSKFAFIFYDNGCQGDKSVQKILKKINGKKQILMVLDSIGGEKNLTVITNKQQQKTSHGLAETIDEHLVSNCKFLITPTNDSKEVHKLFLAKSTLKSKKINEENFTKLDTFFNQIEGR